jgi:hypothetical protein
MGFFRAIGAKNTDVHLACAKLRFCRGYITWIEVPAACFRMACLSPTTTSLYSLEPYTIEF